jgi:uncharacterized membrane protein YhhN
MKNKQIFILIYVIIALIEIAADLSGNFLVVYFFKPLLILSLVWHAYAVPDTRIVSKRNVFITGLAFAWLGDVLLMIRGKDLFIPGLGSFLLMQIFYITAFQTDINQSIFSRQALIRLIPFSGLALILYLTLYPNLPGLTMKIAVGAYAISIAAMAWTAYMRKEYVSSNSFYAVFAGAMLFMLSDSLIALNRFLIAIPFKTLWVMSTYAMAQYLIVTGFLKPKQAGN